jgi:hypothetical protein
VSTTVRTLGVDRNDAINELGRWAASFTTLVGVEVVRELATFASDASAGSLITVRCNRDGFTAQVTGRIVEGRGHLLTPDAIVELAHELD